MNTVKQLVEFHNNYQVSLIGSIVGIFETTLGLLRYATITDVDQIGNITVHLHDTNITLKLNATEKVSIDITTLNWENEMTKNETTNELDDVQKRVIEVIADYIDLPTDQVTPETKCIELDLDSLDIVQLIMSLEDEFDIDIPDDDAEDNSIKTVGSFIALVRNRLN